MHGAPLPISHPKFGASPQVAPDYLSRRGGDWFKRGLGRISGWDGERSLTVALTLFPEGRERFEAEREGRYGRRRFPRVRRLRLASWGNLVEA